MKRILLLLAAVGAVALLISGIWPDLVALSRQLAGTLPRPAMQPAPAQATPTAEPMSEAGAGNTFILVNPRQVKPNSPPTVGGYDFTPGEEIVLTLRGPDGKQQRIASRCADKGGNFSGVTIAFPKDATAGRYVVKAVGQKSRRTAQAEVQVEASGTYAEPDTYSGKPYQAVSFRGGGFRPSEEVLVYFDTMASEPLVRFRTDAGGNLQSPAVAVPLAAQGDHEFYLVGQESRAPVRVPFSVLGFNPWVGLDPYTPKPHQPVTFEGHEFAPGEEVLIYLNQVNPPAIAVARADQKGGFRLAGAYAVPIEKPGKNTFVFRGTQSQTQVTADFEVMPFAPVLELTAYAGQPGTTVAFKGSDLAYGETMHAYLGETRRGREVSTFQAGPDGRFEGVGSFTVPFGTPPGKLTITAVGEKSQVPISIQFAVLPFTPSAALTDYFGPAGTEVGFSGQGFAPGDTVTVHAGDRQGPTVVTATADEQGSFKLAGPYTIPEGARETIAFVLVGDKSQAEARVEFTVRRPGEGPPASETPAQKTPEPKAQPTPGPTPEGGGRGPR